MKKFLTLASVFLLVFALLAGCGQQTAATATATPAADAAATPAASAEPVVIRVGASPTPHAEILAVAKELLAKEGYDLQIVEFSDYIQPNTALEDGDLDANYFQHQPYLDEFNAERGTHLVSVAAIHYEPFGIYAGKTASLDALPDGGKIAVPNDTTNEARALLLLQAQGIITLKDGAGLDATKLDIASNPKNIEIVEMEAAQLVNSLPDVDLAVINGNYALQGGLSAATDALAVEADDSEAAQTYANIVAVKEGNEENPAILALVAALESDEVRDFINTTYTGNVVPLF